MNEMETITDHEGETSIDETVDWNEVWKFKMDRNKKCSPSRDCSQIWETRKEALKFWNMSQQNQHRVVKTIYSTDITEKSNLLDIGAGPGTLAIPFAKKVAHVTAVEPAEGMVCVMKEKMAEYDVSNISCVQKRWEDVVMDDLEPPYDVVIASFSLGMPDIREAISKMIDVSSRYVYLYWFAGESHWDVHCRKLWPLLHNTVYHPGPKSDVLYNVLYQMGIYPNVSVFQLAHDQHFKSYEDAMDQLRPQYHITTPLQEEILLKYLRDELIEDDGSLLMRGYSTRVKMWWEKKRN